MAHQYVWAAKVSQHHETVSGLPGWVIDDGDIRIELSPLKRAQVSAFYLGRGFSEEIVLQITHSCVFQVVMKNVSEIDSENAVAIDLSTWRIVDEHGERALQTKQAWNKKWKAMAASEPAKLSFRWATFPFEQTFEQAVDFAWGMILFGEMPNKQFDVITRWEKNSIGHHQRVNSLLCPE